MEREARFEQIIISKHLCEISLRVRAFACVCMLLFAFTCVRMRVLASTCFCMRVARFAYVCMRLLTFACCCMRLLAFAFACLLLAFACVCMLLLAFACVCILLRAFTCVCLRLLLLLLLAFTWVCMRFVGVLAPNGTKTLTTATTSLFGPAGCYDPPVLLLAFACVCLLLPCVCLRLRTFACVCLAFACFCLLLHAFACFCMVSICFCRNVFWGCMAPNGTQTLTTAAEGWTFAKKPWQWLQRGALLTKKHPKMIPKLAPNRHQNRAAGGSERPLGRPSRTSDPAFEPFGAILTSHFDVQGFSCFVSMPCFSGVFLNHLCNGFCMNSDSILDPFLVEVWPWNLDMRCSGVQKKRVLRSKKTRTVWSIHPCFPVSHLSIKMAPYVDTVFYGCQNAMRKRLFSSNKRLTPCFKACKMSITTETCLSNGNGKRVSSNSVLRSTCVHAFLFAFACFGLRLLAFVWVCMLLHAFAYVCLLVLAFACVCLLLPAFACVCLRLRAFALRGKTLTTAAEEVNFSQPKKRLLAFACFCMLLHSVCKLLHAFACVCLAFACFTCVCLRLRAFALRGKTLTTAAEGWTFLPKTLTTAAGGGGVNFCIFSLSWCFCGGAGPQRHQNLHNRCTGVNIFKKSLTTATKGWAFY